MAETVKKLKHRIKFSSKTDCCEAFDKKISRNLKLVAKLQIILKNRAIVTPFWADFCPRKMVYLLQIKSNL